MLVQWRVHPGHDTTTKLVMVLWIYRYISLDTVWTNHFREHFPVKFAEEFMAETISICSSCVLRGDYLL